MKKIFLTIVSIIAVAISANAQYNMSTQYNQHFNLINSKTMPSKLGMDFSSVQLNFPVVPDIYAYGGNTAIGVGSFSNMNTAEVDRIIGKLRPINVIGAGLEMDLIGFGFKVKKDDEEFMNFSVQVTDRAGANLLYTDNLMKLLWKGNKQFEGQTVDLGLTMNAAWLRDYRLGFAMPINISALPEDLKFRGGLGLKYVQGIASLYMPASNANFTTGVDGRSIGFSPNYNINYTGFSTSNFMGAKGAGVGFDLGITGTYKEQFEGTISLVDLGKVNYKKNTYNYTANGNLMFEGVNVSNLLTNPKVDLDSAIIGKVKGSLDSGASYKMPLPTRLIIQGEYKIGAETKSKERPYNQHTVYLTYIQGFNYMPGTSKRAFVSLGYSYALNYVLNVGTNIQTGGYNKFGMGMFMSLRMGPIRVGVASNQLFTYFIAPKSASGIDFALNGLIAF